MQATRVAVTLRQGAPVTVGGFYQSRQTSHRGGSHRWPMKRRNRSPVDRAPDGLLRPGRGTTGAPLAGQRIDDCQLVSAGRGRARALWVFTNGADTFVPVDDVVELWEAA